MTPIASRFAACLLGLVLTGLLPFAACAEKRVALVIGNANYQSAGKLVNPANDAQAMASLFKAAGFDQVELKLDLDAREFKRVLRAFGNTTAGADIIVVYYAGHGIEVERKNRMVPVDASLKHEDDVEDETISLERLTDIADGAKKLGLIILDACRPLAKNMERKRGHTRDIAPGVAQVEPTGNTLIAFATTACTRLRMARTSTALIPRHCSSISPSRGSISGSPCDGFVTRCVRGLDRSRSQISTAHSRDTALPWCQANIRDRDD